jgi:hypothetical protein
MPARLLDWGLLKQAEYIALDTMRENIEFALDWIPDWAGAAGLTAERSGAGSIRLSDPARDIRLTFLCADVFEYIRSGPAPADLLIAHAVLDLLPLPESLAKLFTLTQHLAWLTINFDGLTTFEPLLEPALDAQLEALYHASLDQRPTGGDSRTGRHLFAHLAAAGARLLAAGPSDWVVHALDGKYPADEAYFLNFILHFFEESLTGHAELDPRKFADWLARRRAQVDGGQLVYIAHQMDFLAQV